MPQTSRKWSLRKRGDRNGDSHRNRPAALKWAKLAADFRRGLPKVEDSPNNCDFAFFNAIVHGVGKSFRKQSMICTYLAMRASKQNKGINVLKKAIQKIKT
jgi:hypothetical protein